MPIRMKGIWPGTVHRPQPTSYEISMNTVHALEIVLEIQDNYNVALRHMSIAQVDTFEA